MLPTVVMLLLFGHHLSSDEWSVEVFIHRINQHIIIILHDYTVHIEVKKTQWDPDEFKNAHMLSAANPTTEDRLKMISVDRILYIYCIFVCLLSSV